MSEKLNNLEYENILYYILYKRDRNPDKTWGHIFGFTTVFSYYSNNYEISNFSKYELIFNSNYETKDDFLTMIIDWHNSGYQRKCLDKYKYESNYLYDFIYAISYEEYNKNNYYFRFSEMIDNIGLKFLLKSYSQNNNYIFTNIALASYYFHNKKYDLSYKFYLNSLKLDGNNPYFLYKFSLLLTTMGGLENIVNSEKIMKKVVDIIPDSPFVYEGYGYVLNLLGRYTESISFIEKYEKLTNGKHRTFEPFMRKSESYIGLGDFKRARIELNKINDYYFGEGYAFLYNEIDNKLKKLGY